LRHVVDSAGLSCRELENATSGDRSFYSKSQWGRWLNGQSLPPRKAARRLAERLAEDEIDTGPLLGMWDCAFVPHSRYSQKPVSELTRLPQQLPIAPRSFTGRSAELGFLTHLAERATEDDSTLVIVISGTAGVGKTALALHLAHQVSSEFPDGQLFVNLRGFDETGRTMTTPEALTGFLGSFGTAPEKIPASVDGQAALYRSLLADKRILVVLDNAHDPGHVRDLLPASPGCLVLVTSRNQMTGLIADGAHLLRLDPFTLGESRALLTSRIGSSRVQREPDAADELIGLCARLPLALSVAGAYSAGNPQLLLSQLVAEFRSRRLDLLETGDPATTARSVFTRSYQHLTQPAARMFRLLGLHPGPDISLPAAASLAATSVDEARKALDELTRAHLVEEHVPGRFASHDLLRAYAAEQAHSVDDAQEVRQATQRFLDHYLATLRAGTETLFPGKPQREFPGTASEVPHECFGSPKEVLSWVRAERPVLLAVVEHAAESGGLDLYCSRLARLIMALMIRSGHWHDLVPCQRLALAAAERLDDPVALGHAHHDFAHACALLGDTETAAEHLALALQSADRTDDLYLARRVRSGMAMLLEQQGQYAEALEHGTEVLLLTRKTGEPAAIAHAENMVGCICARLGQYQRALRHCERALALSIETGERPLEADILDSLGETYLGLGDHAQALVTYQRSLDNYRQLGDGYIIASALTGLGDACLAMGDRDAARDAWEQALAVGVGRPNPDTEPIRARLARLQGHGPAV
jgi:tetratricopeptide (TPR) repeat protein